ncbi:hypothetical protein ACFL4H_00200 [Candidatus Neomarinimicrobiota bacterium]
MGDRVSIQFQKKGVYFGSSDDEVVKSLVLFNHWGGREFPLMAIDYIKELRNEIANPTKELPYLANGPLGRLEPQTVLVDFIRYITKDLHRSDSSLYLGKDEHEGDNSDNGHFLIDLDLTDEELLRSIAER